MLFVGYRTVLRQADATTQGRTGRAATTDNWLASLQVLDPSATIEAVLAADVPVDQAIFVIGPDDDPQLTITHFTISTLAWPRQVGLIRCRTGEATDITVPTSDVVGAALVWDRTRVSEPDAPGRAIGPHLRLITGTEATQWVSFCSP
ncbi:MAG: hypothetical protein Q8M22_02010 [Actinomycetota bacterium]|nr:hypothetical protein [Actinomycetota bacterium]